MRQREIKFRAWDGKKMWNNIVLGDFSHDDGSSWIDTDEGWWYDFGDDSNVWLQYIGLKDKNGKEIYEGDILSITNYGDPVITNVGWYEDINGWRPHCFDEYNSYDYRTAEIIGNIFENPELVD